MTDVINKPGIVIIANRIVNRGIIGEAGAAAPAPAWAELDAAAGADRLHLKRTTRSGTLRSVEVCTLDGVPVTLFALNTGDLVDEDGDLVMRRATAAALAALVEIR